MSGDLDPLAGKQENGQSVCFGKEHLVGCSDRIDMTREKGFAHSHSPFAFVLIRKVSGGNCKKPSIQEVMQLPSQVAWEVRDVCLLLVEG